MFLDFGFTTAYSQRFRDDLGRFARLEGDFELATMAQLAEFSKALLAELKAQFIAGTAPGGDRTGTTARLLGKTPTIDTFEAQSNGLWARIRMGGAASWIETGTPMHRIPNASNINAKTLHFFWQRFDDAEVFFKSVMHPGYKGDRFVERAMDRIDLEDILARIASDTFVRLFNPFGTAGVRPGALYTGGTDAFGSAI